MLPVQMNVMCRVARSAGEFIEHLLQLLHRRNSEGGLVILTCDAVSPVHVDRRYRESRGAVDVVVTIADHHYTGRSTGTYLAGNKFEIAQ